jgi:hypothetical protein
MILSKRPGPKIHGCGSFLLWFAREHYSITAKDEEFSLYNSIAPVPGKRK